MPRLATLLPAALLAVCTFLVPVSDAKADMAGFGSGAVIPDNNATGITSNIDFTTNELITNLQVTVDFGILNNTTRGHTYVGDLAFSLTGPGGTINLFHRPGVPASTFGFSGNLSGVYTWADGGGNFSTEASVTPNNRVVANGTYAARDANDNVVTFSSQFANTTTAGRWTLRAVDSAAQDVGGFIGWTLNIQSTVISVPEPSSAVFLTVTFALAAWFSHRQKISHERSKRRLADRIYY